MSSSKKKTAHGKKASKEPERVIIDPDEPIKPDDQLELSTAELEELFGNALFVREALEPTSQVIYNNKHKKFMPKKDKTTFVTLINLKSTLLLRESEEAKTQIENELCRKPEDFPENDQNDTEETIEEEDAMQLENIDINANMLSAEEEEQNEELSNPEDEINETYEEEEINKIDEEDKQKSLDQNSELNQESQIKIIESIETIYSLPIQKLCSVMKLKNEFNFFNRFTLTKDIHMRSKDTQTTVTKKKDFEANALLSGIYDAYIEDFSKQQEEREKEKRGKMASHLTKKNIGGSNKSHAKQKKEHNLLKATEFIDRILNLNVTDAIVQDFRYYEDPSDQFRDKGEGTLMQMWIMTYTRENNLFVTDISWSPDYYDMFAVTLAIPQGDLPFTENSDVGYVALWSLKNSSYPEYVSRTHCGALCLSFNRDHGYVLAVGLRDGSLAVYNVSLMTHEPQYTTDAVKTKHTACVRQVIWRKDLPSGELNFFSVSEDGTVCQWMLMKRELIKILRMSLVIDMYPEIKQTGIKQKYYGRGTMITFNPDNPDIYLVGTVEGYVFKCNTKWINYMQRFQAHQMPVNRIDYNKFNSNIYLTCSEDFTVKLWEDKSETPLIIFDLQTNLSDVRWSPFSSTVFGVLAAVDCRVIFYDMDASLKQPVCEQLILPASKYRLTRIAFDSRVPIVVIGSSRSTIVSFKLSPNLRTMMKAPKKGVQESTETLELEKLNSVLQSIRE